MNITTGTTVYRTNYYGTQAGLVIGVVGTDAVVSWTGGGRNELVGISDLRTDAAVAPITVDSTPAGIYAAMMRANASDSAAPQSRLYGLLSDYLRRTLAAAYGPAGEAVYEAIISSGECTDYVIEPTLQDYAYRAADNGYATGEHVTMADLRTGDVVFSAVGPVVLVGPARHYPNHSGASSVVIAFDSRMSDTEGTRDQRWVAGMNRADGKPAGSWTVQGCDWVPISRVRTRTPRSYVAPARKLYL